MSFRTTLLIIIVLVGIAVTYFLFFNQSVDDTSENEKPKISKVYDLPLEQIQQVRLSYADDAYQTLTVVKNADDMWQLTTPFKAHADIAKVNEMLGDFLNKRIKQILDVTAYDQYGLEIPTIKVELWKNPDGSPKIFFIGKKGINYSVYTKEQSETHIFLIESSALDDLAKSPTDLRDRTVIKFSPDSITDIQFQKPEAFSCKKEGNDWKMKHPLSVNADTDEIDYILSELHSLQVTTFEADGEDVISTSGKYGLDTPRIHLTLKGENETYGLAIGSAVPPISDQDSTDIENVYVKSIHQGGIYTVSDDIVRILNKSVLTYGINGYLIFSEGIQQNLKSKLTRIKLLVLS